MTYLIGDCFALEVAFLFLGGDLSESAPAFLFLGGDWSESDPAFLLTGDWSESDPALLLLKGDWSESESWRTGRALAEKESKFAECIFLELSVEDFFLAWTADEDNEE